jgi:glyoxylase-like metal-dependent hydrolase (beta-lactamase superfamily II)
MRLEPAMTRTALLTASAIAVVLAAGSLVDAQHQRPPQPPDRLDRMAEPPQAGEVGVLPVQGNVYLLNLGEVNIVAQVGADGILLVDTGPAEWSERIARTILERFGGRPIRYIINTHMHPDHVGGNAALMKMARGDDAAGGFGGNQGAKLIAHENAFNRLSGSSEGETEQPQEMLPTSTFFTEKKEIYFNGEPIEILFQPAAHTDGDVMVFFRGSDVIASGDLFSTLTYPILDEKRGGTIQGHLDALNRMLDITVPRFNQQGGTMVIPGHGRLSNESDVDDYRNWMTIVRDRVLEMVKKGMTIQQIKAAKPTLDFDGVFVDPRWTPDQFLEATYRTLGPAPRTAAN